MLLLFATHQPMYPSEKSIWILTDSQVTEEEERKVRPVCLAVSHLLLLSNGVYLSQTCRQKDDSTFSAVVQVD